jgi:hypothetical protein
MCVIGLKSLATDMTTKRKIHIILDTIMLILMPLLMSYSLVGKAAHEWLGIGITALFVIHNILNIRWYKSICKGKYSAVRIVLTIVNLLLLVDIILLVYSGINLSENIFVTLPNIGKASLSRVIHLACSHWGILLMSFHFGFHGKIFSKMIKNKTAKHILLCIAVLIGIYGIYAFINKSIWNYLFPVSSFIFFDVGSSLVISILDYISIIALFAFTGYCTVLIITNKNISKKEKLK